MTIIDLDNQTNLTVDICNLEKISAHLSERSVELIICDNHCITEINEMHRGISKATDVLSFPINTEGNESSYLPLGSIVISSQFVEEKANELKHTIDDELSLLYIHGILHLLGYDHEIDFGEMREKERETIQFFSLPSSLIIRTEES